MSDLLDAFQPSPRGATPGRVGKVILILLWFGLCAGMVAAAVTDLRLATGAIGTPGTLTVVSCADLGSGRYDCRGFFTPDSGDPALPVAASPDSRAGQTFRAQLVPGGGRAVETGRDGLLVALLLPATGLTGIAFLPYVIVYWLGWRRRWIAVAVGCVITPAGLILMALGFAAL
ncbi:hypothetical protein [Nonomuraea africana]|uniref:Uncharacterized protein n=1 Tax=Nonomuraea africana TaxID=46171 RepID=A0ABR9KHR7_9ACTN|nr:hypothetical protein [Nonomuraea africana]MBE1561556.1 hypothetical protein [Nonomuraea africana]